MQLSVCFLLLLYTNLAHATFFKQFHYANHFNKFIAKCFAETMDVVYINHCENLEIFSMYNPHIILKYPFVNLNNYYKPDVYILCLNKSNDLDLISDLQSKTHFNPRAKFIVYVEKYSKKLLDIAWKYYITSLIIIDVELNVRTYYPLFNTTNTPLLLGNLNRNCSCHLSNTPPPKWSEMELNVALLKIPPYVICNECSVNGIEVDILKLIQSVLKFKINYVEGIFENWGKKYNGHYDNIYGLIKRKEAVLGLGMFQLDLSTFQDFDMTYPYLLDNLVWIVPRRNVIKNINIMCLNTIVLLVTSFILTSFTWWVVSRISRNENPHYLKISNIIMALIKIFYGSTLHKLPSCYYGRFILLLWLLTSWILNMQLQSYLMYFLTYDPHAKSINSYDELMNSNINIGLYNNENVYGNWRFQVSKQALGSKIFCNIDDYCLNRTVTQKDLAVVKPYRTMLFEVISKYLDENGYPRVHVITKQPIILRYINMCFTKGHPIFTEFNNLLPRIIDSGFVEYWINWYDNYVNMIYNKNVNTGIKFRSKALNVRNLKIVFEILFLGYCISITCFLVEICTKYFTCK